MRSLKVERSACILTTVLSCTIISGYLAMWDLLDMLMTQPSGIQCTNRLLCIQCGLYIKMYARYISHKTRASVKLNEQEVSNYKQVMQNRLSHATGCTFVLKS